MEPVAETQSIPWPPAGVKEMHGSHMMPASYPAYDLGQNVTPAFDPPRTLWRTLPDRPPFVDQESGAPYGFLGQSSAPLTHACTPHATYSHYSGLEPSIPLRLPSYQSSNSASRHFSPHLTSAGCLENSHSNSAFYSVPRRKSSGSSRPKRAARAIEYDGIWIDEEELLRGLTEPDGKLTVHQCHLEEDHSPCHLWITGGKSNINAHIQKWHGGEPGGDKLQADCRWSACGKTMLKESIARHIVTVHLEEMRECQGCGKEIVRNDVYKRHVMESDFDACRNLGALITYSGDARKIDARAALQGGGRLLYACP
ncbi:hypothetical protein JVT61DRAFT_770 [Boletus reticuloceps]|uniref:C2H2-type domain-containing protein n=1 Tax=Boletus reticuloceps TaxID=495285 RepID=A0A8I2Z3L9_9AGAM|nr:hypothetical protein JVT61DRAFT_770 [Boletus reticuloceps]